jgi:hypothetical protein
LASQRGTCLGSLRLSDAGHAIAEKKILALKLPGCENGSRVKQSSVLLSKFI